VVSNHVVRSPVVSSLVVNSPMFEGPVVSSSLVNVLWLAGLCVSVHKMSVYKLRLGMAASFHKFSYLLFLILLLFDAV
jgi:hypothetical protein